MDLRSGFLLHRHAELIPRVQADANAKNGGEDIARYKEVDSICGMSKYSHLMDVIWSCFYLQKKFWPGPYLDILSDPQNGLIFDDHEKQ